MAFWFSIFFLSMMWLFLIPIFNTTSWLWVVLITLGVASAIFGFRTSSLGNINWKFYLFIFPLVAFILFMPFPFDLCAILLLGSLLSSMFQSRYKVFTPMTLALLFSGFTILLQTSLLPFYFFFSSRFHRLGLFNWIFSFILKAFGLTTSVSQNSLYIRSGEHIFPFYATWESLGLYPFLNLSLGGLIAILLFSKNRRKSFIIFLTSMLFYALLRHTFLIFLMTDFDTISFFWHPLMIFISFIPLILVLSKLIPLSVQADYSLLIEKPFFETKSIALAFLASIFVFSIVGFLGFCDPGIKKEGRVLIDEKHSNWELTTRKFDKEWYGQRSDYNYYSLAEYLKCFYDVTISSEELTPELLEKCDILIIKTPTEIFSSEEISAIKDFVRDGGGLFLIGDHTNVFGMGTYLNPIARQFGLNFNYDATYELTKGTLSLYKPPSLLPHPVVQNMAYLLFATSCTIEAPLSCDNVILGYGLKSIEADYSQKNFFPKNPSKAKNIKFGLFLQAAGVRYGKGRVLTFTDSTVFSNFFMFIPGKPELFLGSMEWLNRKNRYHFLKSIFFVTFLLSGALVLNLINKMRKKDALYITLFVGFLSVLVSVKFFEEINKRNHPLPESRREFVRVGFDSGHSNMAIPDRKLNLGQEKEYLTFYVWLQRLDFVPSFKPIFKESGISDDAVVIVNPQKEFANIEIERFVSYIENGGRALVLDDPRNIQSSTAYQLLQPFGMRIEFKDTEVCTLFDREGNTIYKNAKHVGAVTGGEGIIFDQNKQPVLSISRRGSGILAVFVGSYNFTNGVMGSTSMEPDEELRKLYDLEYWIFEELLNLKKNGEKKASITLSVSFPGQS